VKFVYLVGAAVAVSLAIPVASQAAELFNQDLAIPGVYFGAGNGALPQEFVTNTADGVEIGLRSKISGIHPQVVPTSDVYNIPIGDTFNFDYSFNPNISGSEISLVGLTASITVHDFLSGLTATFDPSSALLGNTSGAGFGAPGGYQNSEKISFGFLDPGYNPNLDDTFSVVFTVNGLADGPLTVDNTVVVGGGAVPEPATWGLMILGFAAVGAGLRNRRRRVIAATA
jgi:hypothetical protein